MQKKVPDEAARVASLGCGQYIPHFYCRGGAGFTGKHHRLRML
jgi:hypothetical protein